MAVFDQLYTKYQKQISVASQSCVLIADHTLPKLEVQDKNTQEIVCHIFNFLDQIGGLNNFNL